MSKWVSEKETESETESETDAPPSMFTHNLTFAVL